jgi:hypothetical protein
MAKVWLVPRLLRLPYKVEEDRKRLESNITGGVGLVVRDLGRRNYHVAEATETQRRNRRLRLSLLDGFVLPEGSQRLLAFPALKGRPIRRPVVAGTLWPVATEDHASSNLRSALARLQRGARAAVKATTHEIGLSHEVTVDLRDTCGEQRHAPVTVGESEWRYVLHGGMTAADRQTTGPGPRVA